MICFASISRILSHLAKAFATAGMIIIYLGSSLLPSSSGTPIDFSQGTALHVGKDLAVSLRSLDRTIPEGILQPFGGGVSARTSWITPDGRYPLPCYHYTHKNEFRGTCSDFPQFAGFPQRPRLSNATLLYCNIILIKNQPQKHPVFYPLLKPSY